MQRANQNKSKGQLIIESGCLKEKPNIRNKKNMVWWGKLKANINWNTKTQETESGCLEFLLCWWKLSSHKCRSVERKKIRREIFFKKKPDFQKTSVLWVMLHDAVVAWFFFFFTPCIFLHLCVCLQRPIWSSAIPLVCQVIYRNSSRCLGCDSSEVLFSLMLCSIFMKPLNTAIKSI